MCFMWIDLIHPVDISNDLNTTCENFILVFLIHEEFQE